MKSVDALLLSKGSKASGDDMDWHLRRVDTTPPGMCPIALQLTMVRASAAQTCKKCEPCSQGMPKLIALLEKFTSYTATREDLDALAAVAGEMKESSQCAIGAETGASVLEGLEGFKAEYESHLNQHACTEEIAQKVPCEAMCPAHVDVPAYVALVGEGRFAEAVQMVRKDNPFPTMCALVCEHPCELRCRRKLIDAPINIRGIKKFAVDVARADTVPVPKRLPDTGKKVAVIGGGPSGLTCAYFSALMGHKVTVFEGRKQLGGMTRYGIPAYRFPRERLDEDVRAVLSVGNIDVKLECQVDTEMMRRINEEYDAIYVAIGAQTGKSLRLENVTAPGVSSAVDLLGKIGDNDYPDYRGKKVAIIGGGNVAMDCCRTSVRAGADEVTCIYRRRIDDMTALPAEIESAIAEGVEMLTLKSPLSIEVDEAGNCVGVKVQPQMISAVKRGRPAPVDANEEPFVVPADIVLLAVGQDIVPAPFEEFGMAVEWKQFCVDEYLQATGFDNIYAGGDSQTGPATVIKAIGAGKVAARNIDEFLGFHHVLDPEVEAPLPKITKPQPCGRVEILERPARVRKMDFDYVEEDMSLEEAIQEANRCLRCDKYGCGTLENGRTQYV